MSGVMGITCQICGVNCHVIQKHLKDVHSSDPNDIWTLERYQEAFPLAPILSPAAEAKIREHKAQNPTVVAAKQEEATVKQDFFLHDVFGFGKVPAALNVRGEPIKITVMDGANADLIPDIDKQYIFDIGLTKLCIMALEMRIPLYLWGHSGVGKTTVIEQSCARTKRPFLRVQHTANTEEADIEGQWKVVNGEMQFQLGPLPIAMQNGYVYCADEYDFANPQVLAVYQAVLEGKPLRIKAANMTIHPHANFRFVATGNTNGAGDETGLYQGTQLQNAANYERFGIVHKVEYMPAQQEIGILVGRFGLEKAAAAKYVDFATKMREAFDRREVAIPFSPRSVQFAARLGLMRDDPKFGIANAYINRLPNTSAEFARGVLQRLFA